MGRVAQLDHREIVVVRLDFQKSEVSAGIAADYLGVELLFIVQLDFDLVGIFDHVVVGHHMAVLVDDETRPQAGLLELPLHFITEKPLEELVERVLAAARFALEVPEHGASALQGFDRADVHHSRSDRLGQLAEAGRHHGRLDGNARPDRRD
ncbi:MAG: hypothetical protein MUC57_06305 [Desulfobacterales bacterium]|nr:hypothetical protein [Desulfobacterales bacterium]